MWQLSKTRAWRSMAARLRTTWKLLPEASSTKRSWAVVCFLAQLWSWGDRHFVKYFLRHCCSRSRSPEQRGGETVRVRVKTDHPLDKHCVIIHFVCIFGCAGGRKRIRRLHALRYAGRSPCRCFSPVLIHKNGELLQVESTSIFRNPPAG